MLAKDGFVNYLNAKSVANNVKFSLKTKPCSFYRNAYAFDSNEEEIFTKSEDQTEKKKTSKKKNGYWTKERCKEVAEKYNKRIDFQKGNSSAHSAAFKNGWLDEICSHMSYNEFEPTKWTKQICVDLAKQYKTRGKFKSNNSSAYKIALKHGWLDEIFKDLPFHGYRNERVMIANEEQ
jgi:hypothetical protein